MMFPICSVESLESRRLFAIVLNFTGTAGNDSYEVTQTATQYLVTLNGVRKGYNIADVSGMNFFCGDGDDGVVCSPLLTRGIYADGGNGGDKMIGGSGPDTFLGAAGKDQLYGELGNDRINGAGGNDKVLGGAGGDRLYGGDGNDYIDGGSSGDRMYPGNGVDLCLGQSGDDNFFAIDGIADSLFGGSGTDAGFADSADIRGSVEHVALV